MSQRVKVTVLPDKSGKVRIHWFVRDEKGPVHTKIGTVDTAMGKFEVPWLGGAVGRIACQPRLTDVSPKTVNGVLHPVVHSDDPRAVTCPECKAIPEYTAATNALAELLETANEGAPVKG